MTLSFYININEIFIFAYYSYRYISNKRFFHILSIAAILSLLVTVLLASSALAASEDIELDPEEGEIGDHINIEGDDGNDAKAEYTIAAAAIKVSPSSGYTGTEVTVSCSGFLASKSISITFNGNIVTTTSSDSYGRVTGVRFDIPAIGAGDYTVKVTDGINSAESSFSITTSASISPETSTSSPGYVGSKLTISGVGFIAGRTVTITYDGNQITTTIVNTDGTFTCTFNAPVSIGGTHAIIAIDGINTQQFAFVMESDPPLTIYPKLPYMDGELEDWRFDWCGDATNLSDEVTDASLPVTYTLQIATSKDFTAGSIVLEKTGLTESEYTLSEEEKLESNSKENPYFWHVKAIDNASNEGL